MCIVVKECSFFDLMRSKESQSLHDAYADEAGFIGLPRAQANYETYIQLENIGLLTTICAFDGDVIAGFALVLVTDMPHYSFKLGTMESIFVPQSYRKLGTGLKLLAEAERIAKEKGALGLLVNAAIGSRLEKIMDSMSDYQETRKVFIKVFN